MLNSGFGDQGFEFVYEAQFAEPTAEDEFWAVAFRRFGGEVVLSGDKNIAKRPHQIAAFKENGLKCFFMLHGWSSMDIVFKVAHTIAWWPRIQGQIAKCGPGDAYWVPMALRPVPFKKVELPDGILAKAISARREKVQA
jgi:hypothetical protein